MRAFPWLPICLVLLANIAFGSFLYERQTSGPLWSLAVVYVVLQCGVLSVVWQPVRALLLLGFQSAVGYSFMALVGASLTVVVLAWAKVSSYFLVMIAAALLLRINLHTRRIGARQSFVIMLVTSLVGLGISRLLIEEAWR